MKWQISLVAICISAISTFAEDAVAISLNQAKARQSYKCSIKMTDKSTMEGTDNGKAVKANKESSYELAFIDDNIAKTDKGRMIDFDRTFTSISASQYETPTGFQNNPVNIVVGEDKSISYKPMRSFMKNNADIWLNVILVDVETTMPELQKLLPGKDVKLNEAWNLDLKGNKFAAIADPAKSSRAGKLIKTYKKDGALFGVIEITTIIVPTKGLKGPNVKEGSQISQIITIDGCIDGTSGSISYVSKWKSDISESGPMMELKHTKINEYTMTRELNKR